MNRKFFVLLALVFLAAFGWLYLHKKTDTKITLTQSHFSKLAGWRRDNHLAALTAFKKSCAEIIKRNPNALYNNLPYAGLNSEWQRCCQTALQLAHPSDKTAQAFFEKMFVPYQVKTNSSTKGLFTGYYLPTLPIRLKPSAAFNTPIYALPKDLIKIDLGKFKKDLAGMVITAQLNNKVLRPYPDRATINAGPLENADVIAWTSDPIALFFAQIQGSAIGVLPNDKRVVLSYAGGNGQTYQPIGKILLNKKALSPTNISMQSIRTWLEAHPNEVNTILNQNASYNFFVLRNSDDVIGTEQVPLTPARSLAVDRKFIPLGAPLWLSTDVPLQQKTYSFNHLVIAQDTGGAINGVVRGDVYWGSGQQAEDIAGHMQNSGKLWLLLPRKAL